MNSNYDREQTLIGGDGEQYTLDTTRAQPFMTISDTPPKYAGYWSVVGMEIDLVKRPNWFHQKMSYIFFGWQWTDFKEKNT